MIIIFKDRLGRVKNSKYGFSWTMLFFGFFVPLFRGDWKWFAITLLLVPVTCGISNLVLPFLYNKLYIKDLLSNGFLPIEKGHTEFLKSKGIYVPNFDN